MFEFTIGSFDGDEICELGGLYLLNWSSTVIIKSGFGLYRGDGLASIINANGPKLDKIRKGITALFKEVRLLITFEKKFIERDFTFNYEIEKYFPFGKANNTPLYINTFSNHPPTIIKQLPKMISKRNLNLSCSNKELDKVKCVYETALKDSEHFSSISFNIRNTQNVPRNRNNPVYNQNLKMNIGNLFMKLVKKNFLNNNINQKIFNWNN